MPARIDCGGSSRLSTAVACCGPSHMSCRLPWAVSRQATDLLGALRCSLLTPTTRCRLRVGNFGEETVRMAWVLKREDAMEALPMIDR